MTPRTSVLAFALLLLACHAPATTPAPAQRGDACTHLAYVFYLIADARDRGATKQAQIERVRESVDNPFTTRPEATLRSLLGVVDLVYLRPDASAAEIRESVLAECVVDERGRAVLAWARR